jgi:hypothetical protein
MSKALQSFEFGIKDADELLAHFDAINANPPPANAEVLKRAGLVMALTAWETYVEDRLTEEMGKKLAAVSGSYVGDFVLKKLHHDLKQFHNPTPTKPGVFFWSISVWMSPKGGRGQISTRKRHVPALITG